MTSEQEDRRPWKILNPRDLLLWAYQVGTADRSAVVVLEFFRDRVCEDPDFGEVIADHTRGSLVPGTDVEAIWTFNPEMRYFEIITPHPD